MECKSVLYCSKICQKQDWKQHKEICKFLCVGDGSIQLRRDDRVEGSIANWVLFEEDKRRFDEDGKQFFRLFSESSLEGRQAAAKTMKEIAARQNKHNKGFWLFHSLILLAYSKSKMLLWPNSPLLVLLEIVGPHVLSPGIDRITLLHQLARLADPSDCSTHENQLILGRQLIEHGASVNSVMYPDVKSSLHFACHTGVVTNFAFIQLLLENGADPNAQNEYGATPLPRTIYHSPAAAELFLECQSTDVNVTTGKGCSFLAMVRFKNVSVTTKKGYSFLAMIRLNIKSFLDVIVRFPNSDHPEVVKARFVLQQWCEIQEILVEKGAVDTGV
jgi:hypothetical protein